MALCDRWIPLTKASDTGDLRSHYAYYDITVMFNAMIVDDLEIKKAGLSAATTSEISICNFCFSCGLGKFIFPHGWY